jgi:hypothetical protein
MSLFTDLLLALGLPLLVLVALTVWLSEPGARLPAPLAWLAARRGYLWLTYMVLMVSVLLGRLLLGRR